MNQDVLYVIQNFHKQIDEPLNWHSIWMSIAHLIALRSHDPKIKVGSIIIAEDNTQLLSLGYNGNYKGGPNTRDSLETGKSGFLHAEINALIKCDFNYPKNKIMYVTTACCKDCSKAIINSGIKKVIYDSEYTDMSGVELLKSVGIEVYQLNELLNFKS